MPTTETLFAEAVQREVKRRRRTRVTRILTALLGSVIFALLGGLWLMLAVGIAHHEWLPGLPTIGYWPAVLLSALLAHAFPRYEPKES